MKHFVRIWKPLLCAAAALFFCSCAASTPLARATENPALADSLSAHEREIALRGEVGEGMSRDAVFLAWGRPDRITRGSEGGRNFEIWRYTELRPVYHSSVSIGFGGGYHRGHYRRHGRHHHGYGGYYYPGFATYEYGPDYIPVTASVVKFRNGRVSSWEQAR